MQEQNSFPLERIDEVKLHPENYRLVERVPLTRPENIERLPIRLFDVGPNEQLAPIVILDTETTGTNKASDKIIELALVRCTVSLTSKRIVSVDGIYDEFHDPKEPLAPEIVKLTGITDDMVRGKSIDRDILARYVTDEPLIVAHNAAFDRPFFERYFYEYKNLPWACSYREIMWNSLGYKAANLEGLVLSAGYFYDAHRACNDCLALAWLLHMIPEACAMLLDNARTSTYRIEAHGSPFEVKDNLKSHGFRWDGTKKLWTIDVSSKQELEGTLDYMESLYVGAKQKANVVPFTAYNRFTL